MEACGFKLWFEELLGEFGARAADGGRGSDPSVGGATAEDGCTRRRHLLKLLLEKPLPAIWVASP